MQVREKKTIVLGEDEPEVRNYLELALKCHGFTTASAGDGNEVLRLLETAPHTSAVLLDIAMPHKDGIETLRSIRVVDRNLPVVVLSGESSPANIVEAMRSGATDFLSKPVNHEDLGRTLWKVIESAGGAPDVVEAPAPAQDGKVFYGHSAGMRKLHSMIERVSGSDVPVLIQGETGTGKEIVARLLHERSPRAGKPFLKLNCAALPSELVESELFGYEKGAFTGAFQRKPGMFELADRGTIFLDEIGDMDFKLQAKLLQVLQDSEFQRLGGRETVRVDVRVISATHRNLERAMVEETFREDLYYRLNVVTLALPALRERKEDIVPLAEFLMRKHLAPGSPAPVMTPEIRSALQSHLWPGNVRELENTLRRFVLMREPELLLSDLAERHRRVSLLGYQPAPVAALPPAPREPETAAAVPEAVPVLEQVSRAKDEAETTAILAALRSTRWNRKQAAALLKIDYKALLYKMKKLAIEDRVEC